MVVPMAVIWVLMTSLLLLTLATAESSSPSVAKPGCPDRCGEVEIPYPFGIGSKCSLGEWFSVDCNHSTTPPKPFLSKIQSEVTNISYNSSTITINWPIVSSSNCIKGSNKSKSADLTGSFFVFSEANNKFIAVGCNSLALITSNTTRYGGCRSLCGNQTLSDKGFFTCNGIDCCQTDIPADLKVFDINITRLLVEKEENDCEQGFVVDHNWFRNNIRSLSDLKNREFVPVVLDWTISKLMSDLTEVAEGETISRYCGREYLNSTSFRDDSSVVGCVCKNGYQGNPYLYSGCQDIDECKQSPCLSPRMICENTNGSYSCAAIVDPRPHIDHRPHIRPIGLGVVLAAIVCILIFGSLWLNKVVKRRKKANRKVKFFKRNGGLLLKQQLAKGEVNVERTKLFNIKELEKATDRFNLNCVLGQGGQGTVYKGMLTDGKIVAVKKSKMVGESKIEEFINEVVILSQINHRNIVKLMGCCLETEVPLLVYEFIPNGTLFNYLHEPSEELPLTWEMRMRIANEIAGALYYLHSAASQPIFHRDIKSSNILLDEKYRAKIADFGTSRSVAIDQTHLTTRVQGTFGYLDPEFFQSSQFTEKSDVYSFGVVLVELLTGQAPISCNRLVEGQSLVFYFIDSMERNILFDIIDERVIKEGRREDIIVVANLAKRCLNLNGRVRPTMKEVVVELGSVQTTRKDENICIVEEVVRKEETVQWEDTSTSTRSYLDSDTFRLLDQ